MTATLEYRDGALLLLDQTRLPHVSELITCHEHETVVAAIKRLSVRGAPAIGLAAAYGIALAAARAAEEDPANIRARVEEAASTLRAARPTAVNLMWAVDRMLLVLRSHAGDDPGELADRLLAEANRMLREDEEANAGMGRHGAALLPDGANVLTHCNAGALATGAFGTALGVIRAAHEEGKEIHVWVDETRPLLQGARLTTWELREMGVPHTLITDNMAGHFMARGLVDLVVTGADRIVANGDTANKIGTYSVAVLARAHGIPFYIAAPTSTVDLKLPSGDHIEIEERRPEEVVSFAGARSAPEGTHVANPAFDVTPASLITAIITEQGVVYPPFAEGLRAAVAAARDQTQGRTEAG